MEGCYPKWLYHPGKEPILVKDQDAHDALDLGWVESPAEFEAVKKHQAHGHKKEHKAKEGAKA